MHLRQSGVTSNWNQWEIIMRIKHETVKGFWKESILIHFEINCKKKNEINEHY